MVGNERTDVRREKLRHVRVIVTSAGCRIERARAARRPSPRLQHRSRNDSGYARATSRCTNSGTRSRIHIDKRHIASVTVAVSSSRPDRPPSTLLNVEHSSTTSPQGTVHEEFLIRREVRPMHIGGVAVLAVHYR